jgi:hypothetical protein
MSPVTENQLWALGDPIAGLSAAVNTTLNRLRVRGGFGLTFLAGINEPDSSAFDASGDAFGEEAMLPMNGGSASAAHIRPPGDSPPAQINPGKLLDLIQQPPEVDLRDAFDPGTSTLAELDEKRRELQYRKDWLEALLSVTRDELAAFDEARKQRLIKDRIEP